MSHDVGHRRSSDLVLLWLWRMSAAVALIGPLAWESPYAEGEVLKRQKYKNTKKKKKRKEDLTMTQMETASPTP